VSCKIYADVLESKSLSGYNQPGPIRSGTLYNQGLDIEHYF